MRSGAALALAVAACAIVSAESAAGPRPSWTVFADCAGAYVANSRVTDPDRPAAMTSQMSDVAEDYAKAARAAYPRRSHAKSEAAHAAVAARIEATARRLATQPRAAAEHIIDACPQTEG